MPTHTDTLVALGVDFKRMLDYAHARGLQVTFAPVPDRDDNLPEPKGRFLATICDHSKAEHVCWSSSVTPDPGLLLIEINVQLFIPSPN